MTIEWNKVTWYSKIAAVVLFVATFFLAFWLGTMKPEKVYVEVLRPTQHAFQIRNIDWKKYLDNRYGSSTFTMDFGEECHNFSIDDIEYGDLNRDGEEDAVVRYFGCWNGTGGGQSEIFTLTSGGQPIPFFVSNGFPEGQKKLFEGAGGHGYYGINKEGKLHFDFPIYKESDGNCCPSGGTKSITYEWDKALEQFGISNVVVIPPEDALKIGRQDQGPSLDLNVGPLIDGRVGGGFHVPDIKSGTPINMRWTSDQDARSWGDIAHICIEGVDISGESIREAQKKYHTCVTQESAIISTTAVSEGAYTFSLDERTPLLFESMPDAYRLWIYVFDNLPQEGRSEWAGMIIGMGSNTFKVIP